jgi:hypothetical protein
MRLSYVVPMRWMVIYEYEVPGGTLNLNLPLQGNIPMAEPGIEPGTSWSVVRNSDHSGKWCRKQNIMADNKHDIFISCSFVGIW